LPLALVDTLAGPESRAAGQEWHNLGFLRGANGQHDGAVEAYERALTIRRQTLPERDPLALTTYRQLASSLRARAEARAAEGQIVAAWNDYARALDLTDFSDGPDSEPSKIAMMQLVLLLEPIAAGSTDVMLSIGVENIVRIAERTVAWLETELAPDDPRLAGIRAGLDVLRLGASATSLDARQTRDAARRSLASAEATSGPDSREAALALLGLGRAETSLREFDAARASLARALAIRERVHGAASEPAAEVRRAIGELLQEEGKLPEARAEFERAIAIVERVGGNDSPLLVPYLKALAGLLNGLGDRQQAGRLESRVAAIEARASADVSSPEGALRALLDASDLEIAGRQAEARSLRERSLPTLIRSFGEGHIVVAAARLGLARNLIKSQDFAAAAVLVEQAIAAAGRTFGERSSEYAVAMMMQVELEKAQQDYAAAEATLKRIVAINAEALGAAHPQGFAARFDLADILMTQRKGPEGVQVVLDATRDVDRYAREVLPTLAVAEQQAFLEQTLPTAMTFALMSIHIQRQSLPELYDRIGGWKGLLLRGIDRQAAIARLGSNRDASADLRRLTAVRNELAALTQAAPSMDAAQLRRERDRLTTEKEALERRLAALVPETPDRWMGIDSLRARMPARTALVDVFRHGYGDQARYAAVVVLADERVPRYADLGPAQRIERFVNEWRRAVTNDQFAIDEFWRVSSATIDEIAKVMPDSLRFVWVSADGNLSRLPWATMSAYNERVGRANAAQVPSARALMPLLERSAASERHGVVLVGGVDFEAGTRARELPGTRWQPLPGTATEIQSIARLADSLKVPVRSVTGAGATPSAVASAFDGARIVHLATHGFFFGESEDVVNSRGVVGASPTRVGPAVSSRNPLAESGLALAGANVNPAGNLTAEQILALDLRGLDLVVLSACETGRGTEVTGQGVLGLQASLLSAGSRGMLMSLWKVPDESTAFLMERFYFYYLDGYSAPTALRDAQRDVLADERFKNPIHWAGWVFVGTLDG
ncbi:MAG TPA: CHAT domain-containing protein, partial [Gemmatimonadaceae bacterium]|nr:CHAT domain-containing protein [Gemmatimonadaceae bacterium]